MSLTATPHSGSAPAGLEAPCAYLAEVLSFQAANGGPFPRSVELEYAVRRLARGWMAAALPERALGPWLAFAARAALGDDPGAATLERRLRRWALDECLLVPSVADVVPSPCLTPSHQHWGAA